jgi:ATP-binding cassette subfamily F protein 3
MISFSNLALRRGRAELFGEATFQIHDGWHIGLTGRNGTGKSSLLAMLLGRLHQDAGDLSMPPKQVIAHVAQETEPLPQSSIEFVIDGDAGLREIERAISVAEKNDNGEQLGVLYGELGAIDGYTARTRAARLLDGLGFHAADIERPVSEFSGGFRMRLNLARALMCRSDLLLLDEPTNHLDLDAILWLEQWLKEFKGTIVLISHDRDFLDNTANHILNIELGKLTLYRGSYSDFERQRAAALEQQQAMYIKQQRERAHIQSFVDRFRAQATKARQAQSRLKALERMQTIAAAHVDSPFEFQFLTPKQIPNPLLRLSDVTAGYGETVILEPMDLTITPETRVALIGPNGAGKSTLIRVLTGQQAPLSGQYNPADGMKIGYFAQHTLEQLDPEASAYQHILRMNRQVREQDARDFLGGFGFHGDQAVEPCAGFSGGEKARLVMALLIWQRPNLLLLDEPTNHLDLEMRHALTLALQDYQGAIIVVSHDRHLLRSVTDELWLVADGRVQPYEGDLDEYATWITQYRTQAKKKSTSEPVKPVEAPVVTVKLSASERKLQRQQQAEARQRIQPLTKESKQLEKKLEKLLSEKQEIDQQLADTAIYESSQADRLKQLLKQQTTINKDVAQVESKWLSVTEQLEVLTSGG